jgi:hypothetical protein
MAQDGSMRLDFGGSDGAWQSPPATNSRYLPS